jgi:TonB-linked SusC/RagA family outer membrane protein
MRKILQWKFPLMTILCSALIATTPAYQLHATPAEHEFFQQSTPLKTLLKQIGAHYKVAILFEESLVQGKTSSYKFNPKATTLAQSLAELLTPIGLKAHKVDEQNYVVIAVVKKSTVTSPQTKPEETNNNEEVVVVTPVINSTESKPETVSVTGKEATAAMVKGRVVNTQGEEPVPAASITVKGTKIATTSDADGYFSIQLPAGSRVLNISHINYSAVDVPADIRNSMLIRLAGKEKMLSEVVVLGTFKRPKENFTGSATTITGDQIREVNSISALDAIKLFEPSIRIPDNMAFGSDPNRLPNITLRGTNNFPQQTSGTIPSSGADFMATYSTNPNQPLFILDGYEVSLQKIYDLDMNRIATFTILKDAAATSVYGSRAANGVIVVDTKQPEAGKLRMSYSGMMQVTGPDLTVYDLTNAAEKLEVERLAGMYNTYAQGIRPDADAILRQQYSNRLAAVQRGVNTYWLSQPVRTGFGQRHSVYLEGGDKNFRYGIDLGYNSLAGVMKNSGRNTYSGAMNFSYRSKVLQFKNVLSVTFNNATNSNYGSFGDYVRQNPYWNPYDENGNYVKVLETVFAPTTGAKTEFLNPLYNTTLNTVDKSGYGTVMNQTSVDWNIGKGFRLTGRMGITRQTDESDAFLPAEHTSFVNVADITRKGSYTKGFGKFFSYDGSLQLDYSRKIGKHQIFNTTGVNIAQTASNFVTVIVEGFPNQRLDEIGFGNGYPPNSKPSNRNSISRRVSAFSNFNYNFDNRFQVDASISTDGSSQFGINNRFAPFWSLGGSWNLHQEKFIRQHKYINQLRLRGTWGVVGDSRFPPYLGITTYRYYTDQAMRGQLGATIIGYGNPNLQWQQTLKRNAGLDISLFASRINLGMDVYNELTQSLILDINTAPSVGVTSYRENVGVLENKGYEFRLNAFLIRNKTKKMNWTVFVNGSHNSNKIKELSNQLKKQNELNDKADQTRLQNRYEVGRSVNAIWAVRSMGIDPSNGREVYLNRFDSLTYVWDVKDKVIVGDAVAKLRGNFGTSFMWKGFTLGLFFSYELGGMMYNQTLADRVEDANLSYNVDRRVLLGRWKTSGDVTYFKGLADENGRTVVSKTNATSRFVQKSNFINAESITLSYQLPEKLNKQLKLNGTRVNFTVNDIQRWSSIEIERGTSYPFARNFTINISTQF